MEQKKVVISSLALMLEILEKTIAKKHVEELDYKAHCTRSDLYDLLKKDNSNYYGCDFAELKKLRVQCLKSDFDNASIFPQFNEVSSQLKEEIDSYTYRKCIELNIDPNVLKNQLQEIDRLNGVIDKLQKRIAELEKTKQNTVTGKKSRKKRNYYRKCGICGRKFEQSDMVRTNKSDNGWACEMCYNELTEPVYDENEF